MRRLEGSDVEGGARSCGEFVQARNSPLTAEANARARKLRQRNSVLSQEDPSSLANTHSLRVLSYARSCRLMVLPEAGHFAQEWGAPIAEAALRAFAD